VGSAETRPNSVGYARHQRRHARQIPALLIARDFILGAFSAPVISGKAALALSTLALPVGYAASVLVHFL
jgi:hypothetical protein